MSPGGLPVEDRLDIADLVHRYAALTDQGDAAGVAALFVPEGVLASPTPPHHLDPVVEAVGAVAIAEAVGQLATFTLTVHTIVGHVCDPDGEDGARARSVCRAHHVSERDERPFDVVWTLRYDDRLRRTPDGWRFARRDLYVDLVETRVPSLVRDHRAGS